MGEEPAPPTHPLLFTLFAEYLHPYLNQLFFKHYGGGLPPLSRYFLDFL